MRKVVPVQEVEREGESEPDADEGELLDRIRQKVIDNLDSWNFGITQNQAKDPPLRPQDRTP